MKNAFQLWDEKIFAAHEIFGFNGAIRNGLEFHEVFGAFAGFSPALITRWAAQEWFWKKTQPLPRVERFW